MKLKTTLFGNVYQFKDVKEVLAKANELRSGDVLAGVAAASSQERVAAKQVLSEMTVADIRNNPVIAYEDDCVTRLIQDDVNETAYNQIKNWSISELREYVLSDETSVTVLDLCNQLHVSRRTLQNAFHAILGIGPNAWLKRIRLNAVRRELISPWSQSTTVKDAAMQWGFWHLGQFATDYQQLFAEKPSLTLHQRMREWG